MVTLRRRALILFAACLILLFIGIWLFQVEQLTRLQAAGETVEVLAAARPIPAWTPLSPDDLKKVSVPATLAGLGQVTDPMEVLGTMLLAPLPEGVAIPAYLLAHTPVLTPSERAWEIRHGNVVLLDSALQPGDAVDILAALSRQGEERVEEILAGARVIAVTHHEKEYTATLALTREQSVALMEAENFARQVRVIRRPQGGAKG